MALPMRVQCWCSVYFAFSYINSTHFQSHLGSTFFPLAPLLRLFYIFVIQLDGLVTGCILAWDSPDFLNYLFKVCIYLLSFILWAVNFGGFWQIHGVCIHHCSAAHSSGTDLKVLCALPVHLLNTPLTPGNHFSEYPIMGIIQYVFFADWLLSLSNVT